MRLFCVIQSLFHNKTVAFSILKFLLFLQVFGLFSLAEVSAQVNVLAHLSHPQRDATYHQQYLNTVSIDSISVTLKRSGLTAQATHRFVFRGDESITLPTQREDFALDLFFQVPSRMLISEVVVIKQGQRIQARLRDNFVSQDEYDRDASEQQIQDLFLVKSFRDPSPGNNSTDGYLLEHYPFKRTDTLVVEMTVNIPMIPSADLQLMEFRTYNNENHFFGAAQKPSSWTLLVGDEGWMQFGTLDFEPWNIEEPKEFLLTNNPQQPFLLAVPAETIPSNRFTHFTKENETEVFLNLDVSSVNPPKPRKILFAIDFSQNESTVWKNLLIDRLEAMFSATLTVQDSVQVIYNFLGVKIVFDDWVPYSEDTKDSILDRLEQDLSDLPNAGSAMYSEIISRIENEEENCVVALITNSPSPESGREYTLLTQLFDEANIAENVTWHTFFVDNGRNLYENSKWFRFLQSRTQGQLLTVRDVGLSTLNGAAWIGFEHFFGSLFPKDESYSFRITDGVNDSIAYIHTANSPAKYYRKKSQILFQLPSGNSDFQVFVTPFGGDEKMVEMGSTLGEDSSLARTYGTHFFRNVSDTVGTNYSIEKLRNLSLRSGLLSNYTGMLAEDPSRITAAQGLPETIIPLSVRLSNEEQLILPEKTGIEQVYPNPANPNITIVFTLQEATTVTLSVFDIMGRMVAKPIAGELYSAGRHQLQEHLTELASGVYIMRLETNMNSSVQRFTLIK